ncbi:MAG: hypothetical protein ACRD02_15225 [Acidimicrobiia bacterium]
MFTPGATSPDRTNLPWHGSGRTPYQTDRHHAHHQGHHEQDARPGTGRLGRSHVQVLFRALHPPGRRSDMPTGSKDRPHTRQT